MNTWTTINLTQSYMKQLGGILRFVDEGQVTPVLN